MADVRNGTDATFYFAAADTTVSYLFNFTNFGTAASRPTLIVNAVLETSGIAAFLIAGALILGVRHRSKVLRSLRGLP